MIGGMDAFERRLRKQKRKESLLLFKKKLIRLIRRWGFRW